MAIPSGSGSEVLKSSYQPNVDDTPERSMISTTASYTVTEIATIVSVVFCEMGNSSTQKINMWIDCGRNTIEGASGNDVYLLRAQPIGAYGTFVFSDKVVLWGGDVLKVNMVVAAAVDVTASWILQDWT